MFGFFCTVGRLVFLRHNDSGSLFFVFFLVRMRFGVFNHEAEVVVLEREVIRNLIGSSSNQDLIFWPFV